MTVFLLLPEQREPYLDKDEKSFPSGDHILSKWLNTSHRELIYRTVLYGHSFLLFSIQLAIVRGEYLSNSHLGEYVLISQGLLVPIY